MLDIANQAKIPTASASPLAAAAPIGSSNSSSSGSCLMENKVFFFANTVVLVEQQYDFLVSILPSSYRVGKYYGELAVGKIV